MPIIHIVKISFAIWFNNYPLHNTEKELSLSLLNFKKSMSVCVGGGGTIFIFSPINSYIFCSMFTCLILY